MAKGWKDFRWPLCAATTIDNKDTALRRRNGFFHSKSRTWQAKITSSETDVMWNDWPIDPNNSFANAKERTSTGCSMVNRLQTRTSTKKPFSSVNCNFVLVSAFQGNIPDRTSEEKTWQIGEKTGKRNGKWFYDAFQNEWITDGSTDGKQGDMQLNRGV